MVGQVNWYEDDVMLVVDNATDELVSQLAFQVEAEAKVNVQSNGQIDTGFMINAIYSITPLGSRRGQMRGSGRFTNRAGESVERRAAPAPDVDEHSAAVHGAAEYTIYQEMRLAFLYPALEKVKGLAPGIIQSVGRAHFG